MGTARPRLELPPGPPVEPQISGERIFRIRRLVTPGQNASTRDKLVDVSQPRLPCDQNDQQASLRMCEKANLNK